MNAPPTPELALLDAHGERLPALRDLWMRALLVLTLALQLLVWARVFGYSIADSVEFMERAQILVKIEPTVDEGVIRPFGYSSVMLPFFLVADWIGVSDPRPVSWCISLLQIGLALALVYYSVRVAARLAGRRSGWVAGLIVAINPVFLQYSTQPVSDIAAALFIALALESLLDPGRFRRGLASGLWLGAALLMAYKSMLVIFLLLGVVILRDIWKRRPFVYGITCGVLCGIVVQAVLDRLMFGRFGVGITNYLVENVLSVIVSIAWKMQWLDIAKVVYQKRQALMDNGDYFMTEDRTTRGLQASWYYIVNMPQMLVWPVIGLAAVGVVASIVRASWNRLIFVITLGVSIGILSNKGSKDFRLMLPFMPLVGGICACGWSFLFERSDVRAQASREPGVPALATREPGVRAHATRVPGVRAHATRVHRRTGWAWTGASAILIAAILVFDGRAVRALELGQFGGYWQAIDFANGRARTTYPERAAEALRSAAHESPPPRLKLASAYNWAIYMRQSPLVDLVKLPWQLNFWDRYDDVKKTADLETLAEMDFFIVHQPVLTEHPDLFEWVNDHFEVVAGFFDQMSFDPGLGPILLLGRRTGRSDAMTFFDVRPPQSIEAFRAERQLPPPIDFIDPKDPAHARLEFLGFEYRELPGDHHGWITYYWTSPTGIPGDLEFIDRITSPDETNPWQNNHLPAYGVVPTSRWAPGEIVSEGFAVVACAEPYLRGGRYRPLGGAYRRGDLIPVRLWMAAIERNSVPAPDGPKIETRTFSPVLPGSDVPLRGRQVTADGITPLFPFSPDGLVRVGRFFMPVHPAARLRDDGRPIQP